MLPISSSEDCYGFHVLLFLLVFFLLLSLALLGVFAGSHFSLPIHK